ncbi:hypothetical protein JST56_07215 [Candidatus Dependentiae bacterium]|nr:hypothetical protein [Candidatus Dependentiae bacterium]
MKRIIIPDNLKGKQLFDFLIEHKALLIAQKKGILKCCEPVSYAPALFTVKEDKTIKAATANDLPDDIGSLRVKVVCNAALWCDSAMDVLFPDCWNKSMKERKGMIPHIFDHNHSIEAIVGDVQALYAEEVLLKDLGLKEAGSTQCLIMESDVQEAYNEKVFLMYKKGHVKQHSIALMYVKIELCINDPDYGVEHDAWKKYSGKVINQDLIEAKGYFWAVTEIKLYENSAVLFGANELTPTLDVSESTKNQPLKSTEEEPRKKGTSFDLKSIMQTIKN